jgi:hypothetical protein
MGITIAKDIGLINWQIQFYNLLVHVSVLQKQKEVWSMIVVKTVSQLEEALRESDPDVMVVGPLVETIMKKPTSVEQDGLNDRLRKKFNVSAIHFRNENAT